MSKLKVEAGRLISRVDTGLPLYTLHKVGNDSEGYTTTPVEADEFVHTLVRAVNAYDELVAALEEIQCGDRHTYRDSIHVVRPGYRWPCCIARDALAKTKETMT